jgi:hypothetical protein
MDWQAACSDEFKMACHRHHCGNQTCVKCTKDIDLPPRMCYSYSLQNRACQTDKECLGFESCKALAHTYVNPLLSCSLTLCRLDTANTHCQWYARYHQRIVCRDISVNSVEPALAAISTS